MENRLGRNKEVVKLMHIEQFLSAAFSNEHFADNAIEGFKNICVNGITILDVPLDIAKRAIDGSIEVSCNALNHEGVVLYSYEKLESPGLLIGLSYFIEDLIDADNLTPNTLRDILTVIKSRYE